MSRKQRPSTPPQPRPPGEVLGNAAYTLDEFRARTGLSISAFRSLRRRGLRTVRVGKRVYISGADWLHFLQGAPDGGDIRLAEQQRRHDG